MEFEKKPRTKLTKLVCGWGVNDADFCTSYRTEDGKMKHHPAYLTWFNMINRCYGGKYSCYQGCSVCDEWIKFTKFKSWWDVNYKPGYALDKDLKIEGNRIYSPETCLYIPVWMNAYISHKVGKRPQGVTYDKRLCKYKAQRPKADKRGRYIGYFETQEAAHAAWIQDLDISIMPDIASLDTSLREIFLNWCKIREEKAIRY